MNVVTRAREGKTASVDTANGHEATGKARAIVFFLLPYAATVLIDLFLLDRRHYHHLGDYSGTFSAGLGWLDARPYVDFPWPLWGLGQVAALVTLLTGLPVESLAAFNHIWIALNTTAAVLGAYLTSRLLEELHAPVWAALGLGFIPFTMPILATGWIHSNPYFALGVLLGPASAVLVRRLVGESSGRLRRYEWTALAILGFIIANNFGAATILMAGGATMLALWGLQKGGGNLAGVFAAGEGETPAKGALLRSYVVLAGIFVASLAGALLYPWLTPKDWPFIVLILMCATAASFGMIYLVWARAHFPRLGLMRLIVAILAGWMLGANILAPAYGYVARTAMGTASAPKEFVPHAFFPTIDWSQLTTGTRWYWFLALAYALGMVFLFLGAISKADHRARLMATGVFVIAQLIIVAAVTGWDMRFPFAYNEGSFGLAGRYLWTGIAAVFTAVLLAAGLMRRRIVWHVMTALTVALGLSALFQGVEAKEALVRNVEETMTVTDAAIDRHLRESPKHVVLVANAYFPERAMMLYAYHNGRRGIRKIRLDEMEGGRIRYIGRYGGNMWISPLALMREGKLDPGDILIVAELADYPDYIEIIRGFPATDTYLARVNAGRASPAREAAR